VAKTPAVLLTVQLLSNVMVTPNMLAVRPRFVMLVQEPGVVFLNRASSTALVTTAAVPPLEVEGLEPCGVGSGR
jgi:hypothetical protein